jgi:type IV pilus biogenesis protein CpaD/CtpE
MTRTISKLSIVAAALALAGCAQTPPPAIEARVVQVDVPVATRCVDPARVPAAVPPAGLSGEVHHDVSVLAKTDLALRSVVDQLMALIWPCTVNPPKP